MITPSFAWAWAQSAVRGPVLAPNGCPRRVVGLAMPQVPPVDLTKLRIDLGQFDQNPVAQDGQQTPAITVNHWPTPRIKAAAIIQLLIASGRSAPAKRIGRVSDW